MGGKSTTRSAEDRRTEAEALQASIVKQVQQLSDSGQWRAFLEFARSFHTYSLNNVLLILSQNPQATNVAGFRQWQAKGRQVRRGEKSIKIFGYREKRFAHDDDQKKATEDDERVVRSFPTLSVFDITQTDPIEGAEPLPEDPTRRLIGDDDHGLIAPLTRYLTGHGWGIQREPLTIASGYTDPERRHARGCGAVETRGCLTGGEASDRLCVRRCLRLAPDGEDRGRGARGGGLRGCGDDPVRRGGRVHPR